MQHHAHVERLTYDDVAERMFELERAVRRQGGGLPQLVIGCAGEEYDPEPWLKRFVTLEALLALLLLAPGGSLVLRLTNFGYGEVLAVLGRCFARLAIVKPRGSSPTSGEFYAVFLGFHGMAADGAVHDAAVYADGGAGVVPPVLQGFLEEAKWRLLGARTAALDAALRCAVRPELEFDYERLAFEWREAYNVAPVALAAPVAKIVAGEASWWRVHRGEGSSTRAGRSIIGEELQPFSPPSNDQLGRPLPVLPCAGGATFFSFSDH